MASKNKLSIYLIKEEFENDDYVILKNRQYPIAEIEGIGKVYSSPSRASRPLWLETFFCGSLSDVEIFTSNARALLLARVTMSDGICKTFAITMGYGKYMLADDVVEDDFGLKVVLNTIPPDSIRRINKTNIGGNQKTSNEQLPLESEIDDFGFDIDRDLISTITGRSEDENFATGIITGGELLSLTAEVDISNLPAFLRIVYSRYISAEYKTHFPWIDHIKRVKDNRLINTLNEKIIECINTSDTKAWMAVPEVIQWEFIRGFKYNGKEIYNDIDISTVVMSFRNGLTSIDQLKGKNIRAISSLDDTTDYASWPAYKCLYGEVEVARKAYCINNGKWYHIDRDFVSQVNREYDCFPVSEMVFMPCNATHKTENEYTTAFVATDPSHLLCMDAKVISHGGGRSKVELCDILTADGTFIHIKPYSSSATLSHLFSQAVVSAELVRGDPSFLIKANLEIRNQANNNAFVLSSDIVPRVIFGIISKSGEERPQIPFFSKVAIRHAKQRLSTMGCSVSIKNIRKT